MISELDEGDCSANLNFFFNYDMCLRSIAVHNPTAILDCKSSSCIAIES